jgi:DUF4097 and DUF4098 domain-containing protein YvlB
MRIRFLPTAFALIMLAAVAVLISNLRAVASAHTHGHNVSFSTHHSTSSNCQDHFTLDSDEFPGTIYEEEARTLPNQPFDISAEQNGSIQVMQWDKPEIGIKLCKAGAGENSGLIRQMLAQEKLNISGNRITVDSPERNDDFVTGTLLLIQAPAGATMTMSAHNGGISLYKVSGNYTLHTQNGGVSLDRASGKLDVEAMNGGVSIKDTSGDVNVNVQNGGISLSLPETWQGKGLQAHAQNGGMVVKVPATFNSSLEVETSNHTTIICKGGACDRGQRTWNDNGRVFRIGPEPALIRASTVNGGVVIKDLNPRDDDDFE